MTGDHVIPFVLPPPPPRLVRCEVCLIAGRDIELRLYNGAGDLVCVLEYGLTSKPEDFDLDELHRAWDCWRGQSDIAS